ncbi:hypothetical protein C8F04DRAFT_1066038 [Mycena alexandri]|uniref:Uncharacterized protein n=1 Tax=Mycena alexandri TaxID=1745969 RepID=A0AAD6XEX5_9AGAR|nr:hypothetical protein C8F04DRAFT_1066038 [Mycena alexandri]
MTGPAAYQPDETPAEIFSEHTWLQGAFLACIAYGMQAILFFMSLHLLAFAPARKRSRWNVGLASYMVVMFILGTLYMAGLLEFTQEAFVDARNIPGGPNAYEDVMYSLPIDMLANVTVVLLTWLCDLVNIWRCYVVYRSSVILGRAVITLPVLLSFATLAIGILWLKQVGVTSASPWDTSGINFTTPYFAMSLALNILITIMIAARLMMYRWRINRAMPIDSNHGAQYASLAAIIIESAAIYSLFALLFLVPFVIGNPLSQLFLQALSPVQLMVTFLIIFRIAQGKGWSSEESTMMVTSQVQFGTQSPRRTTSIHIHTVTTTGTCEQPHKEISKDISLQTLKNARSVGLHQSMSKEELQDV